MAWKSGSCWAVPLFLSALLAATTSRAEDVILLDDTAPQPTATFTPVPAQPAVPTPTPVPAQPKAPTAVPTAVPAQTPVPTPTKVEAAVSSEENLEANPNLTDSARFAQRLGVLRHTVIWLAGDADYSYAFTSGDPSVASGFGLDARVELQFFSWLSLGTYYDLTIFPASQRIVWTGPLGLEGRFIPFGETKVKEFNPYVIVGAGLNSLVGQNAPTFPGNFHAFGGVGAIYPFGDQWGVDLGVDYNFYSPQDGGLQAISARVGAVYSFEP